MKHLFYAFLVLPLLLASCSDDDDDGISNSFTYNGQTYALNAAFVDNLGDNGNGSFDFDLSIISPELVYNPATEEITGVGELLYLDLNSGQSSGLQSGTYNFSANRNPFTLVDAGVAIDFNPSVTQAFTDQVTGGTVEVTETGTELIVTFDLNTINNRPLVGSWRGTPTRF